MTIFEYVLLGVGAFVAAAISGAAGFGGALLLLPLLTHFVGSLAVPLLTLAQMIGNASRMTIGWRHIHWPSVGRFLCTALPCAVIGALTFVAIPKTIVVRVIGGTLLLFVVLRLSGRFKLSGGHRTLLVGGAITGYLSGLVGSAGPLGAAVFLTMGLPPVAYIASEATTAMAMHAAKTVVYQQGITLSPDAWLLAAVMGTVMILGTWVSKRFIEQLAPERFRTGVTVLLGLIALQMVIGG